MPLPPRSTDMLADWLIDLVEARFDLRRGTLRSRTRHSMRAAEARHACAYLLHTELGLSQVQISHRLHRHRSTVLHSIQRMEDFRDDPVMNRHLDYFGRTLERLRKAMA